MNTCTELQNTSAFTEAITFASDQIFEAAVFPTDNCLLVTVLRSLSVVFKSQWEPLLFLFVHFYVFQSQQHTCPVQD